MKDDLGDVYLSQKQVYALLRSFSSIRDYSSIIGIIRSIAENSNSIKIATTSNEEVGFNRFFILNERINI